MSTRPDPEGSGTVEIATRRCPRFNCNYISTQSRGRLGPFRTAVLSHKLVRGRFGHTLLLVGGGKEGEKNPRLRSAGISNTSRCKKKSFNCFNFIFLSHEGPSKHNDSIQQKTKKNKKKTPSLPIDLEPSQPTACKHWSPHSVTKHASTG